MQSSAMKLKKLIGAPLFAAGCLYLLSLQEDKLSVFITLASSAAGALASKVWLSRLPFIPCALFSAVSACYGGYLIIYWQGGFPLLYFGTAITGLSAGGLTFTLPSEAILSSVKKNKAFLLAFMWTFSIIICAAMRAVFSAFPYLPLFAVLVIMSAGIFLIRNIDNRKAAANANLARNTRKKSAWLLCFVFLSCLSAAVLLSAAVSPFQEQAVIPVSGGFTASRSLFILFFGAVLGSLSAVYAAERKGIFSAALFSIFVTEAGAMCLSLCERGNIFIYLFYMLSGFSLPLFLIIYPLLSYYLLGPENRVKNLADIFSASLFSCSIIMLPHHHADTILFYYYAVIFISPVLLSSFFALFSSWKHRLILLKTK